jgi:hypothetical protein
LHEAYLKRHVFLARHVHRLENVVDPEDELLCPETFRHIDPASPFLRADKKMRLVRVERLKSIAKGCGQDPGFLRGLIERHLAGDGEARRLLDGALRTWSRKNDLRPVFASFFDDIQGLLKETGDDWADRLRDGLGLAHHDPEERGAVDVVLFRYPIQLVPRLKETPRSQRRPLVPPTVLDGGFSHAFCPAPRGGYTGHVVDLAAEEEEPLREVLHPQPEWRAEHVWRLGTIRRRVRLENLGMARALHLINIRRLTDRKDYGKTTDRDLG